VRRRAAESCARASYTFSDTITVEVMRDSYLNHRWRRRRQEREAHDADAARASEGGDRQWSAEGERNQIGAAHPMLRVAGIPAAG
jgi:hypothetical protein